MTRPHAPAQASGPGHDLLLDETLSHLRETLGALRFGNVVLTVHEGRVVQIDVTEKRRLQAH